MHLPPPTEKVLYEYMAGTAFGRFCGTSDPSVLPVVPPHHPVFAFFNTQQTSIIERLEKDITSVCGCPPNSETVWGCNVLCLGPADPYDYGDSIGTQPPLPIRLIIKVRRNSSLGQDWATCNQLADTCYKALQDLGGITDVHCFVVEADLVVSQNNDRGQTVTFDPFPLDSGAWISRAPSRQQLLCMTNKIGQPIATLDHPNKYGTGGYYIRLSGPDPSCPLHGAETFLLTSRHVVCEDTNKGPITHLSSSSPASPPAKPIHVIQPGPRHLGELKDELNYEIKQRNKFIEKVESRCDSTSDMNETPNGPYSRYKQELPILGSLMKHCLAHENLTSQVIGTVAYSPALRVRDDFRDDWALISCGPNASTSAYNNSSYISNINLQIREQLMDTVDPAFTVTVDGSTDVQYSDLDFIALDTVFRRSTIERSYKIPEFGSITDVAKGEVNEANKIDGRIPVVYKYGATTGSTYGTLSGILAFRWDEFGLCHNDYMIVGPCRRSCREFSQPGDSGSVIFGLLPSRPIVNPVPVPSASSVGTGRASSNYRDNGYGSLQSGLQAAEDTTKAENYCTPGIIGQVWGGHGTEYSKPYHDITFATPFEIVLASIEEFTNRVVLGLRYH